MSASSSSSTSTRPQVVIAGGGFGGLYSALRLSELARTGSRPDSPLAFDITLVDRSDRFLFLPLLYELAVGDAKQEEVAPTFRSLLASTGIQFVQGEVEGVDVLSKTITLKARGEETEADPVKALVEKTLSYDKVVLALGSEPALKASKFAPKGALEHTMPFYRLEDAAELQRRLAQIDAQTRDGIKSLFRVVIVGGGYSGVELAANLAARLGRDKGAVTLLDRGYSVLNTSPDHVRAAANKRLEEEGVEVLLGVDVMDVTAEKVVVRDRAQASLQAAVDAGAEGVVVAAAAEGGGATKKEEEDIILAADLVVWTAGASVTSLVTKIEGLEKEERTGKIVTDRGLRARTLTTSAVGRGDVYVLGDNAAVEGYRGEAALPATAQVAFQESEVAAWNIWSALTPSAPGPLNFFYTPLGEMLTLGPLDGAISGLKGLFQLEGSSASVARRLVYVMRQPTGAQRLKAAKSWVKGRVEKFKGSVEEVVASGASVGLGIGGGKK